MRRFGAIHRPAPATPLARLVNLGQLYVPRTVDWLSWRGADGDALGNDRFGDCVPCAELRAIELRRAVAWGDAWRPTTADALGLYASLTGFDAATGLPDAGTRTDLAMAVWAQRGIRAGAQFLDLVGWAPVDPADSVELAQTLDHFGPLQLTMEIVPACREPETWASAPGSGTGWDAGEADAEWHRVCLGAWHDGTMVVRSWGEDYPLHPEWAARYVVAVDATLSRDWLDVMDRAPDGLDWDALAASMQALRLSDTGG